jgi:hypothetical protein
MGERAGGVIHDEIPPRSLTVPYDPLWPTKPDIPDDGVSLTCPNCQTTSTFKRFPNFPSLLLFRVSFPKWPSLRFQP